MKIKGAIMVSIAIIGLLWVSTQIQAQTFVPCGEYDAICHLDCAVVQNGVCGYYTGVPTPDPQCPSGQRMNSQGVCICDSDACCQAQFGEGGIRHDNDTDGCTCAEGSTWNGTICTFNNCPEGQRANANGECICDSLTCCQQRFGKHATVHDNEVDGCTCKPGAEWNGTICVYDFCPDGQRVNAQDECICDSLSCCQARFGDAAIQHDNEVDGCTCAEGAIWNGTICLFDDCPEGQRKNNNNECICNSLSCCQQHFGEGAIQHDNETDGCTCDPEATWDGSQCVYDVCPDNTTENAQGDCVCANDTCCKDYYQDAYYDSSDPTNCVCMEGAEVIDGICVMNECPEHMERATNSDMCICADDFCCEQTFGVAVYSSLSDDGCVCKEEATWDGEQCLPPGGTIELSENRFTITGDGESTHSFSATVVDDEGNTLAVPMWVEVFTPNTINPGTLDISSGMEGSDDTRVAAEYTAPSITKDQLIEEQDEIIDYIYVYADVNGEEIYEIIEAVIVPEGAELLITFEKDGMAEAKTSVLEAGGVIEGTVTVEYDDEEIPVYEVRVTALLADGNKKLAEGYTEKDGTYSLSISQYSEDHTETVDQTMKFTPYILKLLQKGDRYGGKLGKYGSMEARDYVEEYVETIASIESEYAENANDALNLSVFTLYFIEYYDNKAEESLDNFMSYTNNIMKDTASLVMGYLSLTDGIYNLAKGDATSGSAKLIFKAISGRDAKASYIKSMMQSFFDTFYITLREYPTIMKEFQVILAAFEGEVTNRLVSYKVEVGEDGSVKNSQKKEVTEILTDPLEEILADRYVNSVRNMLTNFDIDPRGDYKHLEGNIDKAEAVFKSNTEKHQYRIDLQYDWDVGTAFATMVVDITKGAAKAYLIVQTGSFDAARIAAINEAIDAAGNAFNAIKAALSTNHTIEWAVLFYEDRNDLNRSLDLLYTGKTEVAIHEPWLVPEEMKSKEFAFVEKANAETPLMKSSDALFAVADAFESDDEDALEDALDILEEARETQYERLVNDNDEIVTISNESDIAEVVEKKSELMMMDSLADLKLVMATMDENEDGMNDLYEHIDTIADQEREYEKKLQNADKSKSLLDINNQTMMYTLFGLAILVLIGIIIALRKKPKTMITVSIIYLLVLALGGLLYMQFGQSDGASTSNQSETEVEEDDTTNDRFEDVKKKNNVEDDDDKAEDEDKDEDDEKDKEEAEDKKTANDSITNEEYGYTLTVGEEIAPRLTEQKMENFDVHDTIIYCYEFEEDTSYDDFECGTGKFGLFVVEVLTEEQYEKMKDYPYYGDESLMRYDDYYYFFSHPNGELPDELPIKGTTFYEDVKRSVKFK